MKHVLLLVGALTLGGCGTANAPSQPVTFVRVDGRSTDDPKAQAQFEAAKAICAGEAVGRRAAYMAIGDSYGPPPIDFSPLSRLADPIIEGQNRAAQNAEASATIRLRFNACMAERGYVQSK
jgi:hypothetical protein